MIEVKAFGRGCDSVRAMWPYYPELIERPVPRYTSYPPATAFGGTVGADDQARALNAVSSGAALSFYVHIPYCRQICWYCGCNTGAAGRAHRLAAYLDALEGEISLIGRMLGGRGRLQRIAFGGGSPNAIDPIAFVRLVDRLITLFGGGIGTDVSVEIDPRAMTLEWAMTLAIARVTRVSFGVQSFDPEVQAAIGRIQPVDMIETCLAALRTRGIEAINFDLMYGLPGQTLAALGETMDTVVQMQPSRIALFGYAHVPHMFPVSAGLMQARCQARRRDLNKPLMAMTGLYAKAMWPLALIILPCRQIRSPRRQRQGGCGGTFRASPRIRLMS